MPSPTPPLSHSEKLMTTITVRAARPEDREKIIEVEANSTPNLRYVPQVFAEFMAHPRGEFSVAEVDGELAACAKFSVLPDNSAWLETLRVTPARQGLGVGKRLYEHFFAIARRQGISTMRMYTGVNNAVSKGLAERFGFQPAATFYGAWQATDAALASASAAPFQPVTDPDSAAALLMPHSAAWNGFLVMNRTFYTLTPALCTYLSQRGQVYAEPTSGSVAVLGARFMPEQALHIGLFAGDVRACLHFAQQKANQIGAPRLSCLFPTASPQIRQDLDDGGFQMEPSAFVVMERSGLS